MDSPPVPPIAQHEDSITFNGIQLYDVAFFDFERKMEVPGKSRMHMGTTFKLHTEEPSVTTGHQSL